MNTISSKMNAFSTFPRSTLSALLVALLAVASGGCGGGGGESLSAVRSVSVDGRVPKPKKMVYTDHGSSVTLAMALVGVAPLLLSAGVDAIVASGGRKSLERAAGGRSITIEQIVVDSFTKEFARKGPFKMGGAGTADATFKLTIRSYGIMHRGGLFGSGRKSATVDLGVELVGNNGAVLWESEGVGVSDKANWHYRSEYESNPELLRTGWEEATRKATQEIITELRGELGLDEEAEAPAEPVPAPRPRAAKAGSQTNPPR